MSYENTTVRWLGNLLDSTGQVRQARALEPFARKAKSMKPLNPTVKSLSDAFLELNKKDFKRMLVINESVEIDL